jgi:hypothetical protein
MIRGRELDQTFSSAWLVALPMVAAIAGVIWTIAHPQRSWHDRIADTSVVPR